MQMSENMVLMIGGLVGAIVFLYCLVFVVIKGKSRNQKFIEKAKERGCVTTAQFKDSKVVRGDPAERGSLGMDQYTIIYQYFVNGIEYKKVMKYVTVEIAPHYPTEIEIYYDASNPKRSVTPSEATIADQRSHGCLITFLATLFAMGIVFNILERIF